MGQREVLTVHTFFRPVMVMQVDSLSALPRGPRLVYYRNQVKKAPPPAYLQGKEKMASYWRFC